MKHTATVCLILAPMVSWAAFETVVQPSYEQDAFVETTVSNQTNLNSALVQTNTQVFASSSTTTPMEIGTEIGTTTIITGTGFTTSTNDEPSLEEFVEELNAEYVAAEASCTTGSWLANIWCKMKWWNN